MANIKSAKKRIGTSEKARVRNKAVKTRMRTEVKRVRAGIGEGGDAEEAETTLRSALSTIDRTAKKGVIHRNTAARLKSRLTKATRAAE